MLRLIRRLWYNGTLNAKDIGRGNFVSVDIQKKRLELLRSNTAYRERIEQAQRMAGYEDKLLFAARGGIQEDQINTLLNQSEKAENYTKDKTNEGICNSNIITLN